MDTVMVSFKASSRLFADVELVPFIILIRWLVCLQNKIKLGGWLYLYPKAPLTAWIVIVLYKSIGIFLEKSWICFCISVV